MRDHRRLTPIVLRASLGFVLVVLAGCALDTGSADPGGEAPPRIVALIVVDQLRPDLLDRYRPLWQHGFRTVLEQGYRFTQASHTHAFTETDRVTRR